MKPFHLNTPSEVQQRQHNSITTITNQQTTTGYAHNNLNRDGETHTKLGGTEKGVRDRRDNITTMRTAKNKSHDNQYIPYSSSKPQQFSNISFQNLLLERPAGFFMTCNCNDE